jgi:hypothetical protein
MGCSVGQRSRAPTKGRTVKTMTMAIVAVLFLGLVAGKVSAGTPDTSSPDMSAGATATAAPDASADSDSTQTSDAGAALASNAAPDSSAAAAATPAPAANGGTQASAGPIQGGVPLPPAPALGAQCAGSGTYYVQGFGCSAGSFPALPTTAGPSGACGGNAAPTPYGCTAGYLATTGSPVGNVDGSNNCPGISHRTAMGCTPGLP